ncbi:MAG TPA: bifunctional riboflavin kinase/FMN adenylyltransferase [Gaiellaceae bacterium]|nr:bifunctional riboflavin kinase/FMN adenylyltransferase [Gaiellaceae bacterium]
MKVASTPQELGAGDRAVAIGTFDGVHVGHRRVVEAALAAGAQATVVTFDPHPRVALGHRVELICTLERRLELLEALGITETLIVPFTPDLSLATPEEFARSVLEPLGARVVVAGVNFRFGRGRSGDLDTLAALGFDARPVPLVEGVSSSRIRQLAAAGEVRRAATLLGRPVEIEGTVVAGDARGGTLGFPTANLATPADLLVPAFGIYAGEALGHRAATSIGVNPHYGGEERRIEAFLLEYAGDLYGRRLVVELWERLRDERAFASEAELVEQIGRDVEATQAAVRPV